MIREEEDEVGVNFAKNAGRSDLPFDVTSLNCRVTFLTVLITVAFFAPYVMMHKKETIRFEKAQAEKEMLPEMPASGNHVHDYTKALTAVLGEGHFTIPEGWELRSGASMMPPITPTAELMTKTHNAQEAEDLEAYSHFFYGVRGGLILESGALDGELFSTSKMFVKELGWAALHVEANPFNYKKLARNRPESVNLNTALCQESADVHFVTKASDVSEEEPNAVSGIWEFMPSFIKTKWYTHLSDATVATLPTIPCRPLLPILDALGLNHVDFWVLDVEGAELLVLKSMDFTRITVDVMVIELDGANAEKDDGCRDLLDKAGYEEVGSWQGRRSRNSWFVRRDFHPSVEIGGYAEKYTGAVRRLRQMGGANNTANR
jgi:FkbM family methyltransferase